RTRGEAFYAQSDNESGQRTAYYGQPDGLLRTFDRIKDVSRKILRLNQNNMEAAGQDARRIALYSLIGFGAGLALAIMLAVALSFSTVSTLLRPIQALTLAAQEISAGNPDQVVPYVGRDELGQLAQAFNTMAHHLREYRQSQSAQLLRAQQTIQ